AGDTSSEAKGMWFGPRL
uniref:Pyrokinin-5 n=2 Tax=Gyna TaxID=348762 RepID=PPK5_GYNCS|nr:RecName: Full=Pyrokinin-5; AltName: Full=FXPRL-amide; AltName: Full=GynCa-Capa-PK [Gyna cf. cafforum SR-2005]P85650.1 RecName: Full=Pyrokinin-5; AltName: Full=FXPRL-amide; AltName: Full=GynLu-Capa-PK [Gyna lurida]